MIQMMHTGRLIQNAILHDARSPMAPPMGTYERISRYSFDGCSGDTHANVRPECPRKANQTRVLPTFAQARDV
jgi:hypothetical protein